MHERMETLFPLTPVPVFAAAVLITLLAGTVKGIVGFAMPMVMVSLFSSVMDPELGLQG